ncbi:hypothetical protein BT93_F0736 [Corymbia citriodora subsp. variegata]|nr:hypothetical protein BT93_F0736 [Corymbia citriodora subsp. variegata]
MNPLRYFSNSGLMEFPFLCPFRYEKELKIYMNKTRFPIILGNITAPTKIEEWQNYESRSWILFSKINDLMVTGSGSGVIDGRGHVWWSRALTFLKIENLQLSGLTHLDSPRAHIRLQNCTFAKLSSLLIRPLKTAPTPMGSPLLTQATSESFYGRWKYSLFIHFVSDDCISIKGGSSIIDVAGVKCGPGHGISVGSLGYKGAYDTVEGVDVRNCVFKSSDNGARIKTWEGGSGYVRNIHFENILVSKAQNPIIIDQNYSDDQNRDSKVRPPAVKVSNVTYRNVKGISGNEPSIKLRCAGGTPCTDIVMHRIKLDSLEPGKRSYADCENVVNATFSFVDPPISCHTS